MNDKVEGRTELGKTQRMVGSLYAVLSDELQFVNIISANKAAILYSADLLYYQKYIFWITIIHGRWNTLKYDYLTFIKLLY